MSLVWFITGVSSGLGFQIAAKALEHEHKVIGTVRSRDKSDKAVEDLESRGGTVLQLDITNADACFDVWHSAEKIHGHIDVLCNNAGMAHVGALEDFTDEEVHAQMDVNFYGPFRLIRASLPGFRKRKTGRIVNISSVSGIDGGVASGLYAASKFAIEGLSEALARELAEYNINVVAVEPGAFRTNFLGGFTANSKTHLQAYSTANFTMKVFDTYQGKQRGDPEKAAERIVEAVSGEGLAGHPKGKVLRLPLGPDCIDKFAAKIEALSSNLDLVRMVGTTTDID